MFSKRFKEKKAGLLRLLVNLLWACLVLPPLAHSAQVGRELGGAGGEGVGAHWVAELATCHAPGPWAQNLAWPPWAIDQGCSVLSAPFPPPLPSHCHD